MATETAEEKAKRLADDLGQASNPIGYAIKKGLGVLLKNMPENASAYGDVAMESNPDWAQRYSVAGGVAPRVVPTMATSGGNILSPPNVVVAPPIGTAPAMTNQNTSEDGMNMIYGKLAKLNDKQFKQFADEHHGLPGVGYIQGADGKMIRSIENPANKPQVQEPMNVTQYNALTDRMKGVGAMKQAEVYHAEVAQNKKDVLEEKKRTQFDTDLKLNSPKEVDPNTGQVSGYREDVGLWDRMEMKKPIHSDWKDAKDNLDTKYNSFYKMVEDLPANKGKKIKGSDVKRMFRQGLLDRKI